MIEEALGIESLYIMVSVAVEFLKQAYKISEMFVFTYQNKNLQSKF